MKHTQNPLLRAQSVTWLGGAGLCLVPVLSWGAIELTEFQANTPIVAQEVNDNFGRLEAALDGPPVFSEQIEAAVIESVEESEEVPNAVIDVETRGGHVELVLVPVTPPSAWTGGIHPQVQINGAAGSTFFGAFVQLDRSSDAGLTWEERAALPIFVTGHADGGVLTLPPAAVLFVDDPGPGGWRYRLTAQLGSGAATRIQIYNSRLMARELARGE